MNESIFCAGWQDEETAPEVCPLCQKLDPIFEYQISGDPIGGLVHGYCCFQCGQRLLHSLEEVTLARWGAESTSGQRVDRGLDEYAVA